MLNEDIKKKIDFIVSMTTSFGTLVLPFDWWHSSTKKKDGWIKLVDVLAENKVDIEAELEKYNIAIRYDKHKKVIIYQKINK